MEAPPVIRLLGGTVAIAYKKRLAVDNVSALGTYVQGKTEIRVRYGLSASAERNTVLHEILHAVLQEYDKDDEETVRLLTPAILALLRDNEELVRYLTS